MAPKTRKSINNKKKKIVCIQCKTDVLANDDAIECDCCCETLHSFCTQLDKVEIERLVNDPTLEYKCHFCQPRNNNEHVINTILKEMREMKQTMNFMSSQYDEILKGVKKNTVSIKKLEKENKSLREDVKNLKSVEKSTAVDVVLDVAKKAGAGICENEIDEAYFTNRNKNPNKTSVVVKFTNRKSKFAFMKEKKKLKDIDELKTVYVNDFLPKESMEILQHAKSLKSVGFKYVYTREGKIFAKEQEDSRQILLRCMDDVDALLLKSSVGRRFRNSHGVVANDDEEGEDDDDDDGSLSPNE